MLNIHFSHLPQPLDVPQGQNIDDLFDLPAPAALRRGMNDWGMNRHGEKVDGRSFLLLELMLKGHLRKHN